MAGVARNLNVRSETHSGVGTEGNILIVSRDKKVKNLRVASSYVWLNIFAILLPI